MTTERKLKLCHVLALAILFSMAQALLAADFVGTDRCKGCHEPQYQAWQGSDHEMAMQHANSQSVLGDFNDISLQFNGKTNRFFKVNNQYWVNIAGADGRFHDYQIKYTFGYQPLQQYMVEFGDGRVQLMPFAWDSRSKADGGQRWFPLYPGSTDKHQDYFWTNVGQNWNYMCADCHSTNVKKNYDVATNSYDTSFSEINVGCEACHGPASEHLKWSKDQLTTHGVGFDRNLAKPVANWILGPNKTTLTAQKIAPSQQTLVCAQCHSRHVQLGNKDHVKSGQLGQRYLLRLIDSGLYYPDGQIYDENYVYGSFLQSKMARGGVVCSNCHDPHSARLIMPEQAVCLQCHQAKVYATADHHHHQDSSPGAQCVACHMPATTYMQVDARRDHGWHIPRPELAKDLGTPDACLSCHQSKDSTWSDRITRHWDPETKMSTEQHFASIFFAADNGQPRLATALSYIAQDINNAAIIRASALTRMAGYIDNNTLIAIARGVRSSDEHIRIGAIRGAQGIPGHQRWRVLAPLLADDVLSVRSEAARVLVQIWQQLTKKQQNKLQPAVNDYLEIQRFNADRGFAHTNSGNVYKYQGQFELAEQAYKKSITIEPHFANAYVNLADLYRLQEKHQELLGVLESGIQTNPDNAYLPFSIGLAYIRAKQGVKAIAPLKKATLLAPDNAHFHYVYGLSLTESKPVLAQIAIAQAYRLGKKPQHLYALCELQVQHRSLHAKKCLEQLRKVAPVEAVTTLEGQLPR